MIKIKFNKNELMALASLIVNADFNQVDREVRPLVVSQHKSLVNRLLSRSVSLTPKKESTFTLNPAQASAVSITLKTYLKPHRLDIYEDALTTKVLTLIDQKQQ